MVSKQNVSILEEKARTYWKLSRQWRGDRRYGVITIDQLLRQLADLAGTLNNLRWQRAEHLSAELLDQVINNKRCRKKKPTKNVVLLNSYQHLRRIKPIKLQAGLQGSKAKFIIIAELEHQVG